MQAKELSKFKRKLVFPIAWDEYELERKKQIQKIKASVKVDGFRKGKVPDSYILQQYTETVSQRALEEVIQNYWKSYIEKHNDIQLATKPIYKPSVDEVAKKIECEITFEVMPELVLLPLSELKMNCVTSEITTQDIATMEEKVRRDVVKNASPQKKEQVPQTDEQIYSTLGFTGDDAKEQFSQSVEKMLKQELASRLHAKNKEIVVQTLLNTYPYEIPPTMLQGAIEKQEHRLWHEKHGEDTEATDHSKHQITLSDEQKEKIEKDIRTDIIFKKMVNDYKIQPDISEVEKMIKFAAMSTQNPQKAMKQMATSDYWKNYFFSVALENSLISHIMDKGQVSNNSIPSKDLISYE